MNDNIKRDKIFDNDHKSGFDTEIPKEKIQIDEFFKEPGIDERVDENMIEEALDDVIDRCLWAKDLASESELGGSVSKREINQVFSLLLDSVPKESCVEAFSYACDRYSIKPERFYENLCKEYKTLLHSALKDRGYIKTKFNDDLFV